MPNSTTIVPERKTHLQHLTGPVSATNILPLLDLERLITSSRIATDPKRRSQLGQFLTPENVARFMVSLFELDAPSCTIDLLDAGGGSGILTAATVSELCTRTEDKRPKKLKATIWEIDDQFKSDIDRTLLHCHAICQNAGIEFTGESRQGNFIFDAVKLIHGVGPFASADKPMFDLVIMNPPYRKLRRDSQERAQLRSVGIETSNLYSAFVWLSLKLLKRDGELVAITPRSFMNGSYFQSFRRALLNNLSLRHVHVYDSRKTAFASDDVLQENVVFHGIRSKTRKKVTLTTSSCPDDSGLTERIVDPDELIRSDDKAYMFHLIPDETNARVANVLQDLPYTLGDLGVTVSTGRVVSFRARNRLRANAEPRDVPLVFSRHCINGYVSWPLSKDNRPNALTRITGDEDLYLPKGWYVLVNRFSAKEDKRRVVASIFDPSQIESEFVAFDNKLNVLHRQNAGLSKGLAKGLAAFLNSTLVDMYFRQFSGLTQVNATDLRLMFFPSFDELEYLGRFIDDRMPSEEKVNRLIEEVIPTMKKAGGSIRAKRKIEAATEILRSLNAPSGQQNERSGTYSSWIAGFVPNGFLALCQKPSLRCYTNYGMG